MSATAAAQRPARRRVRTGRPRPAAHSTAAAPARAAAEKTKAATAQTVCGRPPAPEPAPAALNPSTPCTKTEAAAALEAAQPDRCAVALSGLTCCAEITGHARTAPPSKHEEGRRIVESSTNEPTPYQS